MRGSRLTNLLTSVVVAALTLAGLFAHGLLGAAFLIVVAAVLAMLTASAWAVIPARGRRLRIVVVLCVLAVAGAKAAGSL